MASRKVGLIGCGTIGRDLALAIDSGKVPNATLVSVFDLVEKNAVALQKTLKRVPQLYTSFEDFLGSDIDFVVEAASQQAVRTFAKSVAAAGKDLMIMSVGAMADSQFQSELVVAAHTAGSRLFIPTGAIAGIDAIRSVKELIDSIVLTTTKSPSALSGAPFFSLRGVKPEDITEKKVIYTGPAVDAVKLFPANVNVAAVLSLAGIGAAKTVVTIVADPAATTNRHEIRAVGSFGEIHIVVNNVQSPGNPKTSYLAVLSAIECLRSACDDSVRIGT
jgi:aspartate dehydrogenase